MYCSGCGQALVAGQDFCPRCGRASGLGMPPMAGPSPYGAGFPLGVLPLAQVERRVNALAVGWFVYAGLSAIGGLLALAFAHAWMSGHGGPWNGHGFGHNFLYGPAMPFFFMKFARVALFIRVALALAAGVGLMQKASWGRWVAIVTAVLSLLHPVLGFIMAIWTLVVLLNRMNAAGYDAMAEG